MRGAGLASHAGPALATGAHRVDAVVLSIALMCTKNFDYEALTLRELQEKRGVDLDRVSKMDVIRGRMIVEYRDGELAIDEPVKDFHGAALKGCDECADFLGRSADISVGSVGSMTGWTSVLVRTERGRLAFQAARSKLDVRGLDDPAALLRWTRLTRKLPTDPCSESSTRMRRSSSTSRSTCGPTRARSPAGLHPPMTATAAPVLHIPEEPTLRAEVWLSAVLEGAGWVTSWRVTMAWSTGSGLAGAAWPRWG